MNSAARSYRFTFGPWNISTGADPFGPPVRPDVDFAAKIREYRKLGFAGVQFHDDDVCSAELSWRDTQQAAAAVKKLLDDEGLFCEFIAPRLWEHPSTIDGASGMSGTICTFGSGIIAAIAGSTSRVAPVTAARPTMSLETVTSTGNTLARSVKRYGGADSSAATG